MPTQCPQAGKLGGKKNGVIVHTDVSALVRIMAAGIIKFSKGELSLSCLFGIYSSGRWEDRMDTNIEQNKKGPYPSDSNYI